MTVSRSFTETQGLTPIKHQGKPPLQLEKSLSRTGLIWEGPPADETRHSSCIIIDDNELLIPELRGSVGSAGQCTAMGWVIPVDGYREVKEGGGGVDGTLV